MSIKYMQFQSGFSVPNPSPFCMKGEILLKMAGVEYASEIMDDPRKAPKGKLPFLIDGGTEIADTALIQRHLESKYDVDFHAGLTTEQRATSHAMARMIEERLYWVTLYSRWIDNHNWPIIRNFWFGSMPPVIRNLVPIIAQKQVKTGLQAQGLGRHTVEDIYAFGAADLAALSAQLGKQAFMFGDQPSSLDAVAYPIIANSLIEKLPGPLLDAAKSHANFAPYVQRCEALWFADSGN
ncbi:glutathione S-transferase family protein [Parasphingorhabdus cellanae]|uniref:Glutathione S-transferase family protein n=1 Tax=Parasphingorhabdus cellanae TaxID=2806553 RepID=A0ABX7T1E2_9SPHN|nr:glutathione S-transferase family protein [Parasphingorhabdus cellanae]QTD55360.1 glutathione S-transferase family protein [Parasphingorhabdus cellanae]